MTASDTIKKLICGDCSNITTSLCDKCDIKKALDILEKQEKYKWHDLRKNPEDLPRMYYSKQYDRSDSEYLEFVYHEEELPIVGYLRKQNNRVFGCEELWRSDDVEKYNVIAWRYIDEFRGGEEGDTE